MKRLSLILIALIALTARAQEPLHLYWGVDFSTMFDNREGDSKYTDTKTYFQTQLAPEIGVTFDAGEATHRIAGGAVWTQPIGSEWDGHRISPTLYYRYDGRDGLSGALGMFGREQLIRQLPNYIWSDSVYYWQRNIRGAMIQYKGSAGFVEALIDWRGMQSATQREAFNIIAQGEWSRRKFVAGGLAMMNHLARTSEAADDQHVVDNFIINPYVGLDWRPFAADGAFTGYFHAGVLASVSRDRGDSDWLSRAGLWLEAGASWRWLEAKNTLYAGKALFPIYSRYGALLDQGEPYYASDWTDRLSIAARLIGNDRVAMRASLDFNLAADNFTFYQRLTVSVAIGSQKRRPRLLPL